MRPFPTDPRKRIGDAVVASEWDGGAMNTYAHKDLLEAGLTDWRDLAQGLHARFATGDFAAGLRFVDAVGAAAEEARNLSRWVRPEGVKPLAFRWAPVLRVC